MSATPPVENHRRGMGVRGPPKDGPFQFVTSLPGNRAAKIKTMKMKRTVIITKEYTDGKLTFSKREETRTTDPTPPEMGFKILGFSKRKTFSKEQ